MQPHVSCDIICFLLRFSPAPLEKKEKIMNAAMIVFFGIIAVICLLAAWRFFMFRPQGTSTLLRTMPADGHHGWRHGVLHYHPAEAVFYRLRSLRPRADVVWDRQQLELVERRDPTLAERVTIDPDWHVLVIRMGQQEFEVAFDYRGETAFTAWLESAPSRRLVRPGAAEARRYLSKERSA